MRKLLFLVAILLLTACSSGGGGGQIPTDFDFDPRGYWVAQPEGDFEIRGQRGTYTVIVGEGSDTTIWQMFVTGANTFRMEGEEVVPGVVRDATTTVGTFTSPTTMTATSTNTETRLDTGEVEISTESFTATWQSLDGQV